MMNRVFHLFNRRPAFQLSALAVVSFAIYALALVRPYNLFEWWSQPGMTVARITDTSAVAGTAFVAAFLGLFLLYWLACCLTQRFHDRSAWGIVLVGALAFNLILLALYPVEGADIFDYAIRGRMQIVYSQNPFYQRPSSTEIVKIDPLYPYVGWRDYPATYGPWWEMVDAALAYASGGGVIATVLAYKLLGMGCVLATAILIALILQRSAPGRALFGVTLFVWNPFVIYSIPGNGHNDALMVLFLVLGIFLLTRKRFILSALAITGGALVKFVPAAVFPIIVIAALQYLKDWPARVRYLLTTGVACGALVVLSFAPYWRGTEVLTDDWRLHLFTTSLPTLFRVMLIEHLDMNVTDQLVSRGALLVLAAWITWQMLSLWRRGNDHGDPDWQPYAEASLSILLFYLLVAGIWFQPWYTIWPVALAALLPEGILLRGSIITSLAAVFKMPVLDFVMAVAPGHVPPVWILEWKITFATLGLPWGYFIFEWLKRRMAPATEHGLADNSPAG